MRIFDFFTGEGAFFPVSNNFFTGDDDVTFGVEVTFFTLSFLLANDVSFFCTKVLLGEITFLGDGDVFSGEDFTGALLIFLDANFLGEIVCFDLDDMGGDSFFGERAAFFGDDAAFCGDGAVFFVGESLCVAFLIGKAICFLDSLVLFSDFEGIFLGDGTDGVEDWEEEEVDTGDSILVLPDLVVFVLLLVPNLST